MKTKKIKTNEKLDYSKAESWIINDSKKTGKKYDLIFFCGTSVLESTQENGIGFNKQQMKLIGMSNYASCGKALSEGARVFVPYQRQISLSYALKETKSHNDYLNEIATKETYEDLCAVLDYYFTHYNKNGSRPFVLAGHSQGAASLQILLVKYFLQTSKKKYLKNMIGAYCLGYGVSRKDFLKYTNNEEIIHFVKGAGDYNCVISWNTEGPGDKGKSFLLCDEEYDTMVVNPLNWKTDETYAGIDQNLGVLVASGDFFSPDTTYFKSTKKKDLCDAQIDLKRGSVICTTNKEYMSFPGMPQFKDGLWGGKSLHGCDGKGYFENIKQNLKLRLAHYFKDRSK